MKTKTLLLMVGLPGSGKSTIAVQILERAERSELSCNIISADDYFLAPDSSEYRWEREQLEAAHRQYWEEFEDAIRKNYELIVLDNCNLRSQNYRGYVNEAKRHGYEVRQLVVGFFTEKHAQEYAARNVHGVPAEKISRMAREFKLDRSIMVWTEGWAS